MSAALLFASPYTGTGKRGLVVRKLIAGGGSHLAGVKVGDRCVLWAYANVEHSHSPYMTV
jgi:hypothetical protein